MITKIIGYLIKAVVLCVVVFGIGSYLFYLKTGQFWKPDFSSIATPSIPSFSRAPKMEPLPVPKETLYKWRKNGRWVYGDKPPKGSKPQPVYKKDQ